jgi:hypothetical protein
MLVLTNHRFCRLKPLSLRVSVFSGATRRRSSRAFPPSLPAFPAHSAHPVFSRSVVPHPDCSVPLYPSSFTRNSALMHFSLAGGFSSPALSSVMRETNYLTSDAREATYKRLLETTLFVLDSMSDMQPVTGRGWRSAFRVRLLHAQVRRRIAKGKGRYNVYDAEKDGVPINQACAFSFPSFLFLILTPLPSTATSLSSSALS